MNGMSLIVKTVARIIVGLILLFGVYIVLHGHLTPGGGFAGGVVVAGCFVLLVLAYGSRDVKTEMSKWRASVGESAGILMFWFLAMLGIFFGTHFFLNVLGKGKPLHLFSGGFIPLVNVGIGIEVGGALFAIFITLAALKMGEKK